MISWNIFEVVFFLNTTTSITTQKAHNITHERHNLVHTMHNPVPGTRKSDLKLHNLAHEVVFLRKNTTS